MTVFRKISSLTRKLALGMLSIVLTFSAVLVFSSKSTPQGRGLRVVKTTIPVAYKGTIAVSDQIIVFGTGFNTGIEYIRPGDKTGRKIPKGDQFSSKFFAVAGSKIVLANPSSFTIAVFDTATSKMTEIPEGILKLRSIGGSMHLGGSIQISGNYAAVITDTGGNDNSAIKVIDVSGTALRVIRFEGSGPDNNGRLVFRQVAIDAKTGMVAAGGGGYDLKVYDFNNPDKEPNSIDLEKYNGLSRGQMRFDDGTILFQTGESYARAGIIDVATGKITEMSRAIYGLALGGGTYVYFASRNAGDTHGITGRAAIGKAGAQPKFARGARPVGRSKNNGLIGFGASAAVTPNGRVFIGGMEDIGRTERFQIYRGARFSLHPDRSTNPRYLMATDLVASSRIVAFKVGVNNRTMLGYIKLR